jgi:putative membrane protein
MKPSPTLALAALFLLSLQAQAQENAPAPQLPTAAPAGPSATPSGSPANVDPAGFAREAAASNQFEILSSEVALRRSQSEPVKDFARSMIDDHRRAQAELEESAEGDSVNVSAELSTEQRRTLEALEQADEGQFDTVYLSAQMKAHDQAIQLLGAYSKDGPAGGLKTYAAAHYPTVRTHMVRAQSLSNP